MATTLFFLDTRCCKRAADPGILKLMINHFGTSLISLNLRLTKKQWDQHRQTVFNHVQSKQINFLLSDLKQRADALIFQLGCEGELDSMTASKLKEVLELELSTANTEKRRKKNLFVTRFLSFADSKKPSTRGVYMQTYSRLIKFLGEENLNRLRFEDITKEWLTKFDVFMSETSPSKNARNIHLRNIRAVFNEALDDEITTFYPFRRFKIRPVATPKRNLKVEDLRRLFFCECEPHAERYRDMFKLMFLLIGINIVDLVRLKSINGDRIEYYRAKTNRLYSVKVEPEAMEIINKYRGKDWLVDVLDRYKNHQDFNRRMNRALKLIGEVTRSGLGGKKSYDPMFPQISGYWARHSWATIAASLDIPKETIAHALGHGNITTTDIYIDFDERKVDEANRRVIDWVFYGKR